MQQSITCHVSLYIYICGPGFKLSLEVQSVKAGHEGDMSDLCALIKVETVAAAAAGLHHL